MGEIEDKINSFYKERISKKGFTYQAVWGDEASWKSGQRFRIIQECDLHSDDVLVDLGCGLGSLYQYVKKICPNINYIAVDVSDDFLNDIRRRYAVETLKRDFFQSLDEIPSADYYCIFGSMNKKWPLGIEDDDDLGVVYDWIQKCFEKAKKGIYLNGFSSNADRKKDENVHLDAFEIIESLLPEPPRSFRIEHTTPPYEFSLAVFK